MLPCLRRTVRNANLKVSSSQILHKHSGNLNAKEFGTVDGRRNTLGDFDRQFAILRRNLGSGKQTYSWNPSYIRPQLPIPPSLPPPVEEDTRSDASTVEPEPDTRTVLGKLFPVLATSILHLLPSFRKWTRTRYSRTHFAWMSSPQDMIS
jgi:hypothetical protein